MKTTVKLECHQLSSSRLVLVTASLVVELAYFQVEMTEQAHYNLVVNQQDGKLHQICIYKILSKLLILSMMGLFLTKEVLLFTI